MSTEEEATNFFFKKSLCFHTKGKLNPISANALTVCPVFSHRVFTIFLELIRLKQNKRKTYGKRPM